MTHFFLQDDYVELIKTWIRKNNEVV